MDRYVYRLCRMKTSDVLQHFGGQAATARALGLSQPSIALWGEYPPDSRQILIELVTSGKLKAENGALDRVVGLEQLKEKLKKQKAAA
jgi:hypothetical protein